MPAINLLEAQEALIQAIKAAPGVAALVGASVYNHVPQGTVYPYLVFRFTNIDPAPPKNGEASFLVTFRLDAFTEYHGDAVNLKLQDALYAALAHATIPALDAFATIDCIQFINASFAEGGDGMTHLASFTYTAYLTPV